MTDDVFNFHLGDVETWRTSDMEPPAAPGYGYVSGVDPDAGAVSISNEFTWEQARESCRTSPMMLRYAPPSVPIENDNADLQFAHLVYLCAVLARVQPPVWDMVWR